MVCAKCNKGFFQISDLHVHRMIHKKEKSFAWRRCGKFFTHKTNLRAHERIHRGQKPCKGTLPCGSVCQSSTYYHHQRSHETLGSKMFPPYHNLPSQPLGLCSVYEYKFRELFVFIGSVACNFLVMLSIYIVTSIKYVRSRAHRT